MTTPEGRRALAAVLKKNEEARERKRAAFGCETETIMDVEGEDERLIYVRFWPGTDIERACDEIVQLTLNVGKRITADFNGVTLTTGDGSATALINHYWTTLEELKSE